METHFCLALANQEAHFCLALLSIAPHFAWHRAATLGFAALLHTHTAFARLDLTLLTSLDSHELALLLCVPLGSHEPFFVVRTPPCFDNHHAGSTHEHAALTRAGDESVFFAIHTSARPAT